MKNKLRKITVDNEDYVYTISDKYQSENQNHTLTVKIFLSGEKKTPLVIDFLTADDYFIGQPLNSGVDLTNKKTNTIDTININKPKHIRELILQGIKHGWTGANKLEVQNGIHYLEELGYDTNILKPN